MSISKKSTIKVIQRTFLTLFALSAWLVTSFPAKAEVKTITLEQAIEIALDKNRDNIISVLDVKKAHAAVAEAVGNALPSVTLNGNFSHYLEKSQMPFTDFEALLNDYTYSVLFDEGLVPRDNSKLRPVGTKLQTFSLANNYSASLEASQIIFNAAVFKGIGASEAYLQTSREQAKSQLATNILNIKKAFYGALLTKNLLQIARESYDNANDNLKDLKAMEAQGLKPEFDIMQAEVRVENIKPQISQLENTYKNTLNGLKVLLSIAQSTEIEPLGDLEANTDFIPDESASISEANEHNFDLKSLTLKKDVDQAMIELYSADYWPSVAAFGSYKFAGSSDNLNFMNYREGMIGINFSINLYKGGQTKNKVEQYQIGRMQTEEQLKQLQDAISSDIKAKINELIRVKNSLEAQTKNVTVATRAYEISNLRFKEGTGTQLEIKNADMELKTAKTNKLQSVYDYLVAVAELEKLEGRVNPKYLKILTDKFGK